MHAQPAPPQVSHKISSICSMDEMILVSCCEVVYVLKALLLSKCSVGQPPKISVDLLDSCSAWYAQETCSRSSAGPS